MYYRAIKIQNKGNGTKYNFIIKIVGNENFRSEVNGPRPLGGEPILYYRPMVYKNICEVKISEITPKGAIIIGLASDRKWNLVSITAYKN